MPTSHSSGSQSATLDTEHTLATITTAGTYVLTVDTNALANGDVVTLRAKLKVGSGGTTRLFMEQSYAHVQATPVKTSLPMATLNEVVFTLEQTDGTGRSFPWEIVAL